MPDPYSSLLQPHVFQSLRTSYLVWHRFLITWEKSFSCLGTSPSGYSPEFSTRKVFFPWTDSVLLSTVISQILLPGSGQEPPFIVELQPVWISWVWLHLCPLQSFLSRWHSLSSLGGQHSLFLPGIMCNTCSFLCGSPFYFPSSPLCYH